MVAHRTPVVPEGKSVKKAVELLSGRTTLCRTTPLKVFKYCAAGITLWSSSLEEGEDESSPTANTGYVRFVSAFCLPVSSRRTRLLSKIGFQLLKVTYLECVSAPST